MRIPLVHADAFTRRRFGGNPAAVCLLPHWLAAGTMHAIAAENNLSETAFLVNEGAHYGLRWFTPAVEVDLCGHATLAAAYALREHWGETRDEIPFHTPSGVLTVKSDGDRLCLDFPSRPPARVDPHPRLIEGLGTHPLEVLAARDYLAVFATEEEVRTLQPNFDVLATLDRFAVIATAPGRESDFVSRFFAPAQGLNEDPVTGSAHCTLTPYWSRRLARKSMHALQVSARGGELWVEDAGARTLISGYVTPYLEGTLQV